MTQDMEFMMNRFPTYRDKIFQAYQTNAGFKALCEDFYASSLILQDWKNKATRNNRNELEYQRLFQDLESEIVNYLNEPR